MSDWPQVRIDIKPNYSGCFGCGQNNPIGLRLKFERDGHGTKVEFTGSEQYQGWPGYLHGGIVGCLLDEVMSNAASAGGLRCITARYETRLKKLIPINAPLTINGHVTRKTRKVIECAAKITLKDGTVAAEGSATHFVIEPHSKKDSQSDKP